MAVTHHHIRVGWKHFRKQLINLIGNPLFLIMTLIGNTFLVGGATIFYFLERNVNSNVNTFFDAIWWAVISVTTVGYGDIVPVTALGKVVSIGLILSGTVLFFMFIGFFTSMFLSIEMKQLEEEVEELSKRLHGSTEK